MDGAPPDSRTSFPQRDERRMQLSVSGKHLDVGDSLRGHVTSAVAESAERYFGDAIEGKVTFQRDRRHAYRADISLQRGPPDQGPDPRRTPEPHRHLHPPPPPANH